MGDTDSRVCTFYIIVIILLNHYLLRGSYLSNSSLYDAGSYGFYWSSTPYGSNSAYVLLFYSGCIITDFNFRYFGFSVRCVAAG